MVVGYLGQGVNALPNASLWHLSDERYYWETESMLDAFYEYKARSISLETVPSVLAEWLVPQ